MHRGSLVVLLTVAACGGDDSPTFDAPVAVPDGMPAIDAVPFPPDGPTPPSFNPLAEYDPDGPLCDITPGQPDRVNLDCAVAGGRFTDRAPDDVPATLRVVSWNVEFGADSAAVVDTLQNDPALAGADFILLSEVARRSMTSSPAGLNQARELAVALAMDYAFAVEWDRRELPSELGEHGVAILSKYPLGNVAQIRHTPLNDWWGEDMLYGGRITLTADALLGGRLVRLYSSHLCTRGTGDAGRAMQAAEIRAEADIFTRPEMQIVGGDLNTWTCNPNLADCTVAPDAEQLVEDFLAAGWLDGTAGWNGITQLGSGFVPQRLDWLFHRGLGAVTPGAGVASASGSDHDPVTFTFALP